MTKNKLITKYNKIKRNKLIGAIIIDLVGILSFLLPIVWETGDMLWAPLSGLLIFLLFPNRKKYAIAGMIEEMLPFTDIIPTACLTWRLEYIKEQEQTLARFLKKELTEDMMISRFVDEVDQRIILD